MLALVLLAGLAGCSSSKTPSGAGGSGPANGALPSSASTSPTDLGRVEIRNYKGKPLTAVAAEPENSIHGPQHVDIATYTLTIHDYVNAPVKLTYRQVLAMPSVKKVVTLNCVDGWSVTYLWQGVLLEDLLAKAGGVKPGAKVLIFECADGYETSLPLDYIRQHHIMLAYRMNDVTMPPERGFPFQVIAEDRYGYKWAKWVTGIDVNWNANYKGYWEFRGYDNAAVLPSATPQ
jgi:DMSO/TMAO reductase YedYZ molybdopterin-dependent catalytic subunit